MNGLEQNATQRFTGNIVRADCLQCHENYRKRIPKQKYCSHYCRLEYMKAKRAANNPHTRKIATKGKLISICSRVTTGAAKELLVAADLMSRGFHVFRALSSSCPWDLIAVGSSKVAKRIEVKTGNRTPYGISWSSPTNSEYDILAVVVNNHIHWIKRKE